MPSDLKAPALFDLTAFARETGARLVEGRLSDFGDAALELAAARDAAVLCPLPSLALWRIEGAEAEPFLQGQTINDVKALTPGRAQASGYCTPKGRLLASFLLWREDPQRFFAALPASLAEPVRKRLAMYVLRAKLKIEANPTGAVAFGLGGPKAAAALQAAGLPCPATDTTAIDNGLTIIGLPASRFLLVAHPASAPALWSRLSAHARAAGEAVWDALSVLAGEATILPATQETFVPQMINLDLRGGLSFTKGCYPGQEIVARMRYLGRLKERLYLAHLASQIAPGTRLYSPAFGEQACGTVANAAPAFEGGWNVLAVMQTAAFESGEVHSENPRGEKLAFRELPYALQP